MSSYIAVAYITKVHFQVRRVGLAKKFLRECCSEVKINSLQLVRHVRTRFGSMNSVLKRFSELRLVSHIMLLSISLLMEIIYQAITRFIKLADIEDKVPNVSGKSLKYSAYAFSDEEWATIELTQKVLVVCLYLSSHLLISDVYILGSSKCTGSICFRDRSNYVSYATDVPVLLQLLGGNGG